ncbi:protein kinase domain-containing protein [Tenacibaculum ascidiaceicola]|uniref:protein kinase domain-containing protein n=1 Tax=Tenacibaculum ascidiaceicola TaxID=1699411 RepID=UPI003895AE25
MKYVRLCPACNNERPVTEMYCQNIIGNSPCSWLLMNVPQTPVGGRVEIQHEAEESIKRFCENGHEVGEDNFMCMECGADIQKLTVQEEETIKQIDSYTIIESVEISGATKECFLVKDTDGKRFFLTYYHENSEPDKAIYDVLHRADVDHIAQLVKTGYCNNRFFEVSEHIQGGSLNDLGYIKENRIETLVNEISRALRDFSEAGFRHRNLCPKNILIRDNETFDLVIIDYSSARLSDYDLDTDTPLQLTRYTAPEAIIGGVSPASDWWSLGMIVLEQITKGTFFQGINDKAFMIHLVTRGVQIPEGIDERILLLLKGLLCRDPLKRWRWEQVEKWLNKEYVAPPTEVTIGVDHKNEKTIQLGDTFYTNVSYFALAAAEENNWEEGLALFTSGEISNWIKETLGEGKIAAIIRNLRSKENIDLEWRFSLALMHFNEALPLTWRGQIIIPAWLLSNPILASELIEGNIPDYLDTLSREKWLVNLKSRKQNVLHKAKSLDIELDCDKFKINSLSTSRVRLKSELNLLRQIYPDAKNISLSDLMGDIRLSEEDLILVLSAQQDQFTPLDQLVKDAINLAREIKIEPNENFFREVLIKPRLEIYESLHKHLEGFSQSNNDHLNRWADRFRIERRLPILQSILCLSISKDKWVIPPKHEYASSLLNFFERKIIHTASRGPLVRLIISKHSPRLDLKVLGTPLKPSEKLINSIINRSSSTEKIDPLSFSQDPLLSYRTRRLALRTANFKRDTGLDSLYLGFPFLINQFKKNNRPRILPIILWPITLEFKYRSNPTLEIGFDKVREEIRLNPALSSSLEPDKYKRIKQIYQEILSRQSLSISEVIDAFGSFVESKDSKLVTHPEITYMMENIGLELHGSGVIFNANFTGQSISEDLRLLQKIPHSGTAMEPILRIHTPQIPEYEPIQSENDRFTVVNVDPSQERAVIHSRLKPGIVIEGPPGTGKSQTIVNIISDCIGRKEKVLVVSQKRAAIQVIMKRLEAVGLDKRALSITDIAKDRQEIIRSIREQVSFDLNESEQQNILKKITFKRNDLIKQIDRLESGLNTISEEIHVLDEQAGVSYRNILSELIEIQTDDYIDIPEARNFIEKISADELNILETEISALIHDWLPSKYENNALSNLKITQYDEATKKVIKQDIEQFNEIETKRVNCIKQTTGVYDNEQAQFYKTWLYKNEQKLLNITDTEAKNAKIWFDLIWDEFNEKSISDDILDDLKQLLENLKTLIFNYKKVYFSNWLIQAEDETLEKIIQACNSHLNKSIFKFLNPLTWEHRFRLKKIFKELQLHTDKENINLLKTNSEYETTFRTYRNHFNNVLRKLNNTAEPITEPKFLAVKISSKINELLETIFLVKALKQCPLKDEAKKVLKSGKKVEFQNFIRDLNNASKRFEKRQESYKKLTDLKQWLEDSSFKFFHSNIKNNDTNLSVVQKMSQDINHFIPYQKFRIRLGDKPQQNNTLQLLAIFRDYEDQITQYTSERWSKIIQKTIRREGLLGWKQRIEKQTPALLMADSEIDQNVQLLENDLAEIKALNKELLNLNYDFEKVGSKSRWHSITRLRGQNYKKLREFIHLGDDLGLMDIRPIWLMSPEVVSQALPLQAGLFDVVIFDEASQMLIDHSIPSLYRAKRVIVSGDEKQMPPANFFGYKIDGDEGEDLNIELSEDNSEEELTLYEEAWNKKEVKDCPDLLTLAKTVLPTTTLQIHYRSQYKALINFSNHAFYSGQLHIPAYHPKNVIEKTKPLEVIRVNGIYNEQTNETEAEVLIEYLSNHWQLPENEILSTGIVTFNKKQADLIEDKIEEKALSDEVFMEALNRERNKQQEGEAMGFFVKNVENVQGDERDMILFSTTFGFNKQGVFRRNFGALGHRGGERRLNVAITRARHKIVIATSMPIKDISDMLSTGRSPSKPRDYIQGYLKYTETHFDNQIEIANQSLKRLSLRKIKESKALKNDGFKNTVKNYIHSLGYETVENNDNNVFYLDLAIEDKKTGRFVIGVECDVPHNSLLKNARHREIWRTLILKKSIPHIHRTTSYKWLQDTENEKLRLKHAIENALNITP